MLNFNQIFAGPCLTNELLGAFTALKKWKYCVAPMDDYIDQILDFGSNVRTFCTGYGINELYLIMNDTRHPAKQNIQTKLHEFLTPTGTWLVYN